MDFHTETDSSAASDFQKGQYGQWRDFPNELGSLVALQFPSAHRHFTNATALQSSVLPLPNIRQAEPVSAAGV